MRDDLEFALGFRLFERNNRRVEKSLEFEK
jgi:hypothetical protein